MGKGKADTINEYLLPVRIRVEYSPKDDGKLERVSYVECNNGEILTGGLPYEWAQFVCRQLNRAVFYQKNNKCYNEPIAVLRIDGNPLQKTDARIATEKDGHLILQDNQIYTNSIKEAGLLGEHLFLERWVQLPIDMPVVIACQYYLRGYKRYNIALCNAWILDLLYGLNIIKRADQHIVKSMDGSGFYKAEDDPYTIVKILGWKD